MRVNPIIAAMALLALPATAGAYIYSTNFNSGNMPRNITVADAGQTQPVKSDYRVGYTTNGWIVELVDGGSYSAVSPTHSHSGLPESNLLTLPTLAIEGETPVLRWRTMSIHPSLPEAYRVLVAEPGGEQTEIFSTNAEASVWQYHVADLSAWTGKEVNITFECNSTNKYMLALDDITVGDPEDTMFQVQNTTPEFTGYGNGTARITGSVLNVGKAIEADRLVLLVDGAEADAAKPDHAAWLPGESVDYDFAMPLTLNTRKAYTRAAVDTEGNTTTLYEGSQYCSNFARTLLVDEGTGMWCNNCPEGTLVLQELERRFGDNIIVLQSHINDILACDDYNKVLAFRAVPRMIANRNKSTEGSSAVNFEREYDIPTDMALEVSACTVEDDMLHVSVNVYTAEDTDNTSDRYRVGYTLTTDIKSTVPNSTYYQSNNLSGPKSRQFYYLPTTVISDLAPMENVVLTSENAFDGIKGALAGRLEAREAHEVSWSMQRPELLEDWNKARIVAYIIDSETGRVVNAAAHRVKDEVVTSVGSIAVDPRDEAAAGPAEYYNMQGARVTSPGPGIYIVRRGSKVTKEIVK